MTIYIFYIQLFQYILMNFFMARNLCEKQKNKSRNVKFFKISSFSNKIFCHEICMKSKKMSKGIKPKISYSFFDHSKYDFHFIKIE